MSLSSQKEEEPPLTFTHRALARLIQLTQEMGDGGLRIGVRGGGCTGLTYSMDWVQAPAEGDWVALLAGNDGQAKVFVDKKSLLFLKGTTVDFVTSIAGSVFKFENPNAKSTCGCGESFST